MALQLNKGKLKIHIVKLVLNFPVVVTFKKALIIREEKKIQTGDSPASQEHAVEDAKTIYSRNNKCFLFQALSHDL